MASANSYPNPYLFPSPYYSPTPNSIENMNEISMIMKNDTPNKPNNYLHRGDCQFCHETSRVFKRYVPGRYTYTCALILLITTCTLCFIPFVFDECQDCHYVCQHCKKVRKVSRRWHWYFHLIMFVNSLTLQFLNFGFFLLSSPHASQFPKLTEHLFNKKCINQILSPFTSIFTTSLPSTAASVP